MSAMLSCLADPAKRRGSTARVLEAMRWRVVPALDGKPQARLWPERKLVEVADVIETLADFASAVPPAEANR